MTWWQGDDLESCRSLSCSDVNGLEIPGFKWLERSGLGFQAKRLVLSSADTLGGASKIIQSQEVGEMNGACFCQIEMQLQAVWEHTVLMPSVAFFYERLYTAASDVVSAVPQGVILLTSE